VDERELFFRVVIRRSVFQPDPPFPVVDAERREADRPLVLELGPLHLDGGLCLLGPRVERLTHCAHREIVDKPGLIHSILDAGRRTSSAEDCGTAGEEVIVRVESLSYFVPRTPRRREKDGIGTEAGVGRGREGNEIPEDELDLVGYTVDLGVVAAAREPVFIAVDCDDSLASKRELDRVACTSSAFQSAVFTGLRVAYLHNRSRRRGQHRLLCSALRFAPPSIPAEPPRETDGL